jgi:hypothetical protein
MRISINKRKKMTSNRLMKREVRTIAGSTLTTSYQNVGNLVTIAAYKLAIVNDTSTDVYITDQTSNDPYYIPADSTLSIGEGLSSGLQQLDKSASEPSQTQYQAKLVSGSAGTGTLIITVFGY